MEGIGIYLEIENPGSVSDALMGAGMHAAMISITEQLPFLFIVTPLFLLLTVLFVITTTDSMAFTISMGVTREGNPKRGNILGSVNGNDCCYSPIHWRRKCRSFTELYRSNSSTSFHFAFANDLACTESS